MKLIKQAVLAAALVIMSACNPQNKVTFTPDELAIIDDNNYLMKVYVVDNPEDSLVLRKKSCDLTVADMQSESFVRLAERMLWTVMAPQFDGVGIAAPQVGINRRVVAVQRFDKEGEPFFVYPNIRITACRGEMVPGPEGCLSIPDKRGEVLRYQDIDISYFDPINLKDTTETVQGYTAVIFQHECDHLDGVLYTDKLQ